MVLFSIDVKRLTSRRHAIVARYRAVARGQDRQWILLDGPHLAREAIAAGVRIDHIVIASDAIDRDEFAAIRDELARAGSEVLAGASAVMAAISPLRSPGDSVALAARPPAGDERIYGNPAATVVIACDVQDPGNLGAIVRVAEAAGASGVAVAGRSADPFGWKALRGSMGSALRLPIVMHPDLDDAIRAARVAGCGVAATVPRGGTSIFEADLRRPVAVLIGGEGAGLPSTVVRNADWRLTIPMQPPVESLNAAVTAAVILYEARRQRDRRSAGL